MKILFVEQSESLQAKWIEPLRKKGWGVVRARSAEDATRMMSFHGDSLEAIAVGESFVAWAEKQSLPFVLLTSSWKDTDILKHQNSAHSAVAYLSFERGVDELYTLFEANQNFKATGTDGVTVTSRAIPSGPRGLNLEDYSQVLSKPDHTRHTISSVVLDAPTVVLGGQTLRQEVEEISLDENEATRVNRTVMIDSTSVEMEANGLDALPDAEPSIQSLDGDELNELRFETKASQNPANPYTVPVSQFSVNPSPIGQVADLDTLRSYLALREQDVAVLSGQVRSSQERIQQLEMLLKMEKARGTELTHVVSRQEQQINHYDQEKQVELDVLGHQIDDMEGQLKNRTEKVRTIEAKLRLTIDEVAKVKERVRVDIRRIRVREKELESQLEVIKKDSSALLQARDEKILELKRKLDLLEFNMELVQEQFTKEKQSADDLKSRLKDAALVMKQANGLLDA